MKTKQLFAVFAILMIAQISIAQQIIYGDQNTSTVSLINSLENDKKAPLNETRYYIVDEAIPNTFTTGNNTLIVCRLIPGSDTNIICSTRRPGNGWGTMVNRENEEFTYEEDQYNDGTNIYSMAFTDPKNGWAVGVMESYSKYVGVVFHTEDGGNSWKLQFVGGSGMKLNSVCFTDPNTGWANGIRSFGDASFDIILATIDGGETWTEQSLAQLDDKPKSSQLY